MHTFTKPYYYYNQDCLTNSSQTFGFALPYAYKGTGKPDNISYLDNLYCADSFCYACRCDPCLYGSEILCGQARNERMCRSFIAEKNLTLPRPKKIYSGKWRIHNRHRGDL